MTKPVEIVRLKITLDHIKPTVLRRIEVPVAMKLSTLHDIIQAVMPWSDSHMHMFSLGDERWSRPSPFGEDDELRMNDSRKTTLAEVFGASDVLKYTYDFGDDWVHTIKAERRFVAEAGIGYPRLIDAKQACPPDDVGGPWGYAELLEALADPKHEQHEEIVEFHEGFDPNRVDRAAIERALGQWLKPVKPVARKAATAKTVPKKVAKPMAKAKFKA